MIKYELNAISNSKSMLFFGGLITLSRAQCRSLPLSRSATLFHSLSLQEYLSCDWLSDAAAAVVAFLAVHVSRTLQVAVAITVFVALSLPLSRSLCGPRSCLCYCCCCCCCSQSLFSFAAPGLP